MLLVAEARGERGGEVDRGQTKCGSEEESGEMEVNW